MDELRDCAHFGRLTDSKRERREWRRDEHALETNGKSSDSVATV
jgi:hypothetical protein